MAAKERTELPDAKKLTGAQDLRPAGTEPEPDLEAPAGGMRRSSAGLWQAGHTKTTVVTALRQQREKRDFSVGSGTGHVKALGLAWRWFNQADQDHDGYMDEGEFKKLAAHVELKLSRRQMKGAFDDMLKVASARGKQHGRCVMFEDFATWFARHQAVIRRDHASILSTTPFPGMSLTRMLFRQHTAHRQGPLRQVRHRWLRSEYTSRSTPHHD